jgi:hypothetical protein
MCRGSPAVANNDKNQLMDPEILLLYFTPSTTLSPSAALQLLMTTIYVSAVFFKRSMGSSRAYA